MTALALALFLVIRTYDGGGVSASDLEAGRRVAGGILQHAGLTVTWLVCPRVTDVWLPDPTCAEAPRPNEVLVRLTSSEPAPGNDDRVLGNAHVDAGTGTLATLYVDRIESMAARAGVDAGLVLGRAMAHEVGHLLLGHGRHRDRGLMRAYWSETVLRSRMTGDWVFVRDDVRRMAWNLTVRARGREGIERRPAQD